MGDYRIWLFLVGLAAGEVAAVVFFIRWLLGWWAARQQGFSSEMLSLLIRRTVQLCLVVLPVCGFAILIIGFWPASSLSFVIAAPLLLSLLLILVVLFAVGELVTLLAQHWSTFRYVLFLPADADRVRVHGCRQGILAAASAYPEQAFADDDELDSFVRGNAALLKVQNFPRAHTRPWQYRLTNDFAEYCYLLSEGYRQGYRQFFTECQAGGEHLDAIRERLLQPLVADDHQLLTIYTTRYLQV
jgi:hypothetical protein